jgi:hypothetical protein
MKSLLGWYRHAFVEADLNQQFHGDSLRDDLQTAPKRREQCEINLRAVGVYATHLRQTRLMAKAQPFA